MSKTQLHGDENTETNGNKIRRGLETRLARLIIASAVLALPVAAIASPVAVPNAFTAGEVISSAEMNANFTAVQTAVNDNDARVTALEGETQLVQCNWSVVVANNATVTANCAAGSYAISGGCFSNAGLRSSGPTGAAAIQNGNAATAASGWICSVGAPDPTNRAFALCCTP
jgi:hypothetical protein